ncbi:ribosomal protein S16 [Rhizopogon vinicolor AM-OR11-026]|uniref:Ribosomal protein S16 n=1 Tax=Rhizopogon vinicolor AM-OR11-026 TaxID=1314800 RepID=A0A1B7NHI4_9AGAM|nr:ribosomal protein S16 [Rhizopogon vinicolor AM-OR11-026]
MPVRLRMAMHGQRHNRIFHLVAINQRARRDAKPMELLGIYDPALKLGETHKTVKWSVDRIKYWLGVGALPSKSVVKLLECGGVLPPDSKYHPKALGPRTGAESLKDNATGSSSSGATSAAS